MNNVQILEQNHEDDVIYGINRDPYKVALEIGVDVVLPTEYQLQLDLDSELQFRNYVNALGKLSRDTGLYPLHVKVEPSKSGLPKRHVTLTFNEPMDVWKRIALQFLLHSDPVREGLNAKRVLLNDPFPIAFFEKLPCDLPTKVEDTFLI